ncbi:MAG TPA: SUMF1/EgtB/PvdO family nonheme iron enzyme [Bacteroidia bacterium]|nr:SUMF1/EgtB/PvdO family nonheme iron enzyme [Bacteroidia bacterium]
MKKFFLFLLPLLFFSCKGKKDLYDLVRKVPQQKLIPPGTVWLRDNIFIDQTEIENFSWQEFLFWLSKKEPARYAAMCPDTLCWSRADVGSASELANFYFKDIAYRNYPVVGISYDQAGEYCNWRTDRVNEYLYLKEKKLKYHPDSNYVARAPKRVKFRLPSSEEWEYAAAAGLEFCKFPMGYESIIDKYGIPVSNTFEYYVYYKKEFERCSDTLYITDPADPVNSGKPNKYGLFHMLGNVSELVGGAMCKGLNYSTPVYSMRREESEGGSYTMRTETYNYKLSTNYTRPEPWLGFRCVCEVLQK